MVHLINTPNHLAFLKDLAFFPISRQFPLLGTRNFPKSSHFRCMKAIKTSSWACLCKGDLGSDSELEVRLEEEILEFMKGTNKPNSFPSKEELIEGGRRDLVEAIVKRRDWLSMGWDLGDEVREESEGNGELGSDFDEEIRGFSDDDEDSSWDLTSFSHNPSSSGRSFEMRDEGEDNGVKGILTRLEKERNISFGENLGTQTLSRYNSDDWFIGDKFNPSKSIKPDMVKTWTIPEYEVFYAQDNKNCDIQTRLQQLELQLKSTLSSLRSKSKELIPKEEGNENLTEIQKLSDALEFQETEIMNAKNHLRSIRAKLAVSEGKVTLAIIDVRKKIDIKQRKIEGVQRAMKQLRSTSIVWAISASQVLLVGSFDGWTTQRRMKKSSSGVFSIDLKLYPGKYEMKFIVDGVWKVDPLRPIVKNGSYENNLFIVT